MTAPKNPNILYHEIHEHPNRDWIVMVHGAGGSTRTWKRQTEQLGTAYNLLIIDLPGHGRNKGQNLKSDYSFKFIANQIWEVVDHLQIEKVHLMGISLGTILCLQMRLLQPDRILSMILPGAIVKLNFKLRTLAKLSLGLARIVGFRKFYNLSARIMMPRANHKKSRDVFIKESKALTNEEFEKWTYLYYKLNHNLENFFQSPSEIPHLLVMGSQDHLFLSGARAFVNRHSNASLEILPKCGHVVSIEKAEQFNDICLSFLTNLHRKAIESKVMEEEKVKSISTNIQSTFL